MVHSAPEMPCREDETGMLKVPSDAGAYPPLQGAMLRSVQVQNEVEIKQAISTTARGIKRLASDRLGIN